MKDIHIVFVHGWGAGPDIWDSIISELSEFNCHSLDLGFTGHQTPLDNMLQEKSVYVTHSLGTIWALQNCNQFMRGLIAINGFSSFQDFVDMRTLKRMKLNLKRNPEAQMQAFWDKTTLHANDQLHVERLDEGLGWLMNSDCRKQLSALHCPVHAVFGNDDPLLDTQLMKDHWDGYPCHIFEGGHNLPHTHSQKCADLIKGVFDAL